MPSGNTRQYYNVIVYTVYRYVSTEPPFVTEVNTNHFWACKTFHFSSQLLQFIPQYRTYLTFHPFTFFTKSHSFESSSRSDRKHLLNLKSCDVTCQYHLLTRYVTWRKLQVSIWWSAVSLVRKLCGFVLEHLSCKKVPRHFYQTSITSCSFPVLFVRQLHVEY